jgi:DNA-binding beta-propeller fold protein YncE
VVNGQDTVVAPAVPTGARLAVAPARDGTVFGTSRGRVWRVSSSGKVTSSAPADVRSPSAIAASGRAVWIADVLGSGVTVLDAERLRPLRRLAIGRSLSAIAVDRRHAWIVDTGPARSIGGVLRPLGNGTVTRVSTTSFRVVGRPVPVGRRPLVVISDGTRVFVGNHGDRTVSVIRASDGRLLATIATGRVRPRALVASGSRLWVAGDGVAGVLAVGLRDSGSDRRTIRLEGEPAALAAAHGAVWAATQAGEVRRIEDLGD